MILFSFRSGCGIFPRSIVAPLLLTSRSMPRVPITPGLLISFPAVRRCSRPSCSRSWICARTYEADFIVTESQLRKQEGCTLPLRSIAATTRSPSCCRVRVDNRIYVCHAYDGHVDHAVRGIRVKMSAYNRHPELGTMHHASRQSPVS